MISAIITAFNRLFLRYSSMNYLLKLRRKECQEQEFKALKLCITLYLWEEKYGIQHIHTLEDVAQVFDRKIEEIQLLCDLLDNKQKIERLEKALATNDVSLAFNV